MVDKARVLVGYFSPKSLDKVDKVDKKGLTIDVESSMRRE